MLNSSKLGIWAAGVPPSSPTLLFRRWVRKVESLISQPMTSGKNELQDHLIFISEKALHKSRNVFLAAQAISERDWR